MTAITVHVSENDLPMLPTDRLTAVAIGMKKTGGMIAMMMKIRVNWASFVRIRWS